MGDSRRLAKKIVLPCFTHTEVCDGTDTGATPIFVPGKAAESGYFERLKLSEISQRVDGKPKWKGFQFNLYPIVLDATGLPWPEANVYILSRLEDTLNPDMSTFMGIADDLVAYRKYVEDEGIDWRHFPKMKLHRPTYRYSAALARAIGEGKLSASVGARRIGAVIAFYSWLKNSGELIPANSLWQEKSVFLNLTDAYGGEYTKKVKTTDVSIKAKKQNDPYENTINDGGHLRPLPKKEQDWVLEALFARGNTEMTLIHLLSLLTGARIQTVLTFRVRNLCRFTSAQLIRSASVRIPIGPGTGVDTKKNKRMSLHIPLWFYQKLLTYVDSERARSRRALAKGGDSDDQYIFLSKFGAPFYSSKQSRVFDSTSKKRQFINGNSVRKFISEVVIPFVRAKYDENFSYQFHDLRASFGMNLVESQLELVAQEKRTLSQVREWVRTRMGHNSAATTDRYLQFRDNLSHIGQVSDNHDAHLRDLTEQGGL